MRLRYGTNPHQRPANATPVHAGQEPIRLVRGEPSYINLLDALAAWQLVHEASAALTSPAAASFKHVSPAGAAIAGPVDAVMADTYRVDPTTIGAVTSAYLRARDADPKSSYGDFVAVSEPVDTELAETLRRLPCDGIIAAGFAPGTVATLSAKKNGTLVILEADPGYQPPAEEAREIYGLRLTQPRDSLPLTREHLTAVICGTLPEHAVDDLLLGMIVLRYTQSNSVAYLRDGMTLGIGAGQQSRVDCTRLAGMKTDTWWLRRHPTVRSLPCDQTVRVQDQISQQFQYLDGDVIDGVDPLTPAQRRDWLRRLDHVSFVSDGAIPFRDNIDHARHHGVRYIAEPGGSIRSDDVHAACREHGIALVHTGIRLFQH
jgi:phosphoribosylaminoimidazolecarboxamide formyltransferase/IMP cyclohydrolase